MECYNFQKEMWTESNNQNEHYFDYKIIIYDQIEIWIGLRKLKKTYKQPVKYKKIIPIPTAFNLVANNSRLFAGIILANMNPIPKDPKWPRLFIPGTKNPNITFRRT